MVLSQSLFQRQHRLHVSDSFPGDICLILETGFGSAIQYLETLEPSYYLFKQPSTHVSPPLPVSVFVSTHMCTPSLSRKLLFAKVKGIQISRGYPWPPASIAIWQRKILVCVCWRWERGASISIHMFLGPKKNPQLAVLSLAPPNLNHIPFLPEPTLGGPSKPASTPPFPPVGRPNPRPHWTANSENEGHTTSPNSWKAPRSPSACSHPSRRIDSFFSV